MHTIFVAHSWKLLTDHVPNGDGLFAWGLLHRLAERGHTLHVACRAVDLESPLPKGLVLHRLTDDANDLRGLGRLEYMRRLRQLHARLLRTEAIDLVHQPSPVDVGVTLALPRSATPLVLGPYWADWPVHLEQADFRARTTHRVAEATRRLIRTRQQHRAHAVMITTEAARAKVHRPREGLEVSLVPPGVELARFDVAAPAPAGRPPTVLFLANLRAHKGIFTLLDAFETVVERMPEARLVVAGSGPDEGAVRARVATSTARANVDLLGSVRPEQVPQTMSLADVFCQPGHGEPFGWSAVEAMACGLPVVVTRAGGLADVVPDDAGLKVPPAQAAPLAEALLELLAVRDRGRAMGAVGRRAVESTYDWERVIDRLEAVYNRAVASGTR